MEEWAREKKKEIRRGKERDAWTERRKELVHGRWDGTGWDEMIVLHVARARTDSINIRRSLGKTLALRSGLPPLLSFIFRMQCLPLPTHLYRDSLILPRKKRRLVVLYVPFFFPPLCSFSNSLTGSTEHWRTLSRWKSLVCLIERVILIKS